MFESGEIITCVDAKPDDRDPLADLLVEGRHYRVRTCGVRTDGELAVAFLSIKVPGEEHRGYAFCVRRFRKLPRADESFTAKMRALRPHREKVPA